MDKQTIRKFLIGSNRARYNDIRERLLMRQVKRNGSNQRSGLSSASGSLTSGLFKVNRKETKMSKETCQTIINTFINNTERTSQLTNEINQA